MTLRISLYSDAIYGLSCAVQGRPLCNLFLIGMKQLKVGNGHSKQKNSYLGSEHCVWSTETTQWTQFFSYFGTIISYFDELYTKVRNTRMWTLHDVEDRQKPDSSRFPPCRARKITCSINASMGFNGTTIPCPVRVVKFPTLFLICALSVCPGPSTVNLFKKINNKINLKNC